MKLKWYHILVVFCCLISPAVVSSAYAQDTDIDDVEITRTEADKMLYSPGGEGELRYGASSVNLSKDSASNLPPAGTLRRSKPEPTATKPADKQNSSKEDEDSIMSFNFLYYIIQKYKLQDIVDQ